MDFPGGAECLKSATLPRGLLLISSAVGQLTLTWEARWPRLKLVDVVCVNESRLSYGPTIRYFHFCICLWLYNDMYP